MLIDVIEVVLEVWEGQQHVFEFMVVRRRRGMSRLGRLGSGLGRGSGICDWLVAFQMDMFGCNMESNCFYSLNTGPLASTYG